MQLNISLHKTRVKGAEMHILVIYTAKRGRRGKREGMGEEGEGENKKRQCKCSFVASVPQTTCSSLLHSTNQILV